MTISICILNMQPNLWHDFPHISCEEICFSSKKIIIKRSILDFLLENLLLFYKKMSELSEITINDTLMKEICFKHISTGLHYHQLINSESYTKLLLQSMMLWKSLIIKPKEYTFNMNIITHYRLYHDTNRTAQKHFIIVLTRSELIK